MIQHRFSSQGVLTALALTIAVLVFCGSRSDAQIVATTTDAFVIATTDTTLTGSFMTDFAMQESTANALVIGTYIDNNHTLSNVLYGGVAPDVIVNDLAVNTDRLHLFYFENPAASGAFTFDYNIATNNSPNFAFMGLELLDVNLSGTVDTSLGATITTTVDNQFIISMVGANNTDGPQVTPAAGGIQTLHAVADANGGIGGGSIIAGYVDRRTTGAAGVKDVNNWNFNGEGFGAGLASIAIDAPPLAVDLALVVDKTTGEMKLRNDTDGPLTFDYYKIESEGDALDPAGWDSLDDQGIGSLSTDFNGNGIVNSSDLPVWQASYGTNSGGDADGDGDTDGRDFLAWQREYGQLPGPADSWIEAGGSSESALAELRLRGATLLDPDEELSLGMGYDTSVFGAADGDLLFNVSLGGSTQLLEGLVIYEAGALQAVTAIPEPSSNMICLITFGTFVWKRR